MTVGHGREIEAEADQQRFHRATELLRVLQRARAMERQALVAVDAECFQRFIAQHFHQVSGQHADPFRLVGIGRVAFEQMAIVLDEGAAAAGCLYDGFGTVLDAWPPRIDVATGAVEPGCLRVEVIVHGTAAAGASARRDADAQAIQHPRRRHIGVGRQARLHAAFEHQHLTGMPGGGEGVADRNTAGQFSLQGVWQPRAKHLAAAHESIEQPWIGYHAAQALT